MAYEQEQRKPLHDILSKIMRSYRIGRNVDKLQAHETLDERSHTTGCISKATI